MTNNDNYRGSLDVPIAREQPTSETSSRSPALESMIFDFLRGGLEKRKEGRFFSRWPTALDEEDHSNHCTRPVQGLLLLRVSGRNR